MSIATALIDATVDAVQETDRQLLDAMKRAVLFDTTAMQQWYDQRDYDAVRRSLVEQMPASLRPTFKPLSAVESTDIYFPLTTATGTYKATGTITINKDLAQGLLKAVETPMLKVGDRVKILRPFTEEEKRKPPHWTPGMGALVGAEGVVNYIGEFVGVRVGKGYSYSWLPETLELIPATDEIAFGPFPSKEEAIAVRLDLPYGPVWEAKSPTGELSFVRCYPNIGDVDTFASFRDTTYKKSEKFPAFADYSARPLDKDGKPFARKHIALTTGATPPSPTLDTITMYVNGRETSFPTTATAAQVAEKLKASGIECAGAPPKEILSLPVQSLPTKEAMTAAVDALATEFNRHSYSVAMPIDPRTGQVVGPLPVPGTRENPVKVAASVPVRVPRVTFTAASQPVTITQGQSDIAYTTAHDVAEVCGTSDRPLGEVMTPTTTGERWVVSALPPNTDADEAADALVAAMKHAMSGNYRTNPLTSATTSATIPEQLGATMPTTEVKPTSRMRRAITEATRRAPVELGLNQAHEAIVKQAARKFKGTAAEKKVVARFLTDLLGSEYGKAGLAAALATVIPQLAPLLGKHEGKAETLAEELATRSATILAVKAGSDLISLLGPLTAILSDMISSAEPPHQITAGSGRSALDEISVTAAPVAATAKR